MNQPLLMLTRGRLAAMAGVNLETIRFYEGKGLLPEPTRDRAGYRRYREEDVQRLLFIKRSQALGFSLGEIKELLELRAQPACGSRPVKELAQQKIESIMERIRDLKRMKRALEEISETCDGAGLTGDCPILKALGGEK